MILYTTVLLCGLLHISQGEVNTVSIEMGQMGEDATLDVKLTAKLEDEIYIKCLYDDFNHPKQILALKYKPTATSEKQLIMVPGSINSPWVEFPDKYVGDFQWDFPPFFSSFNISGISLSDAGIYSCEVEGGSVTVPAASATVEVFVNTGSVTLEGLDDGKYGAFADGKETPVICTAYNGSKPEMTLIIGDERIPFDSVEIKADEVEQYEGNVLYSFKPTQNKKQIICEAIVPGYESQPATDAAELAIYAPPLIDCPVSVTGTKENKVVILCTITGEQLPELDAIAWRTPIKNIGGNEETLVGLTSTAEITDEGTYEVKLTVKIMDEEAYGIYTLEATNTGGTETGSVKLVAPETKEVDIVSDNDNNSSTTTIFTSLLLLLSTSYCFIL